jgi:aspartyl aminopeptidase
MALGVKPEYRGSGVFAQFTAESFLRAIDCGTAVWRMPM